LGDPYPGLRRYLEANDRSGYNQAAYNKKVREAAKWAIEFLVLVSQRQKESEVARVLDARRVGGLVMALLGYGCCEIQPRHYQIAKGCACDGVIRLRELVREEYAVSVSPLLENARTQMNMLPVEERSRPNPACEEQRGQVEHLLVGEESTAP